MKRVSPITLSASVLIILAGQPVESHPNTEPDIATRISRAGERLHLLLNFPATEATDPQFKQIQYFGNWSNWDDEEQPIWNNWDNFNNFDNYRWDSY